MKAKIKLIYNEIYEFSQLCKENHLDSHSAAAAFFMFVSIIPFFMLILGIIAYTPVTDATVLSVVETILPAKFDHFASDIMEQLVNESLTLVSVTAIVAMWTASRSLLTIKQGLNEIRGFVEKRNFIVLRANSAIYTILLLISFVLMLVINVVFIGIERYFRSLFGISISKTYSVVKIIMILRPVITIIVGFLLNLFFFTFLPNEKIKARTQIPGAAIVAVVWYLFSLVFGIYINNYNAYSMYGSLSVVIMILFWLYACMYIMFLGGQFNYYLSLRRENNKMISGL